MNQSDLRLKADHLQAEFMLAVGTYQCRPSDGEYSGLLEGVPVEWPVIVARLTELHGDRYRPCWEAWFAGIDRFTLGWRLKVGWQNWMPKLVA